MRLTERHARTGRVAIIADEGDSVWLYLTDADGSVVSRDCWLCNRIAAPRYAEFEQTTAGYRDQGLPPPAIAEVVARGALRKEPLEAHECRFVWSLDGNSVAAFYGDELLGFIARSEPKGFSRYLREVSPWGSPLDLALYAKVFAMADG